MAKKIILKSLFIISLCFLCQSAYASNLYTQLDDNSGVIALHPVNTGALIGTPIGSFTPTSNIIVGPDTPLSFEFTYKSDPGITDVDFYICIFDISQPTGPMDVEHIHVCAFTHDIQDTFTTRTLTANIPYTLNSGTTYYISMGRDCSYTCGTYYIKSNVSMSSFYGKIDSTDPLPSCCSNVVFLPGIKGSILKKGSDTLWPPTVWSNDISQLALTSSGTSINDIYTDGIINKFYITPIYEPFSNFMDSLVADQTINGWLPMAYDWRFSPEDILANGVKTGAGTKDVIEEIKTLAEHSKTGKVSIVAHSMGGIMGKAIIKKLADEGKDNIIDSFVMVGSPELGTPQAVGSMLHGDHEGIYPIFIAHPADMRAIAQNMPSAYNLLPSSEYFNRVSDPVITFNPNAPFTEAWRNFWGPVINTYSAFSSFITGTGVPRSKPAPNILQDPEVLDPGLLAKAVNFHNTYDNYQFPSHIRVVQVAGWGMKTIKSTEYKMNHGVPGYETKFTSEGDKTVVYPSATSSATNDTYFFNLSLFNKDVSQDIQHRNLLNSAPVENLILEVVKKIPISVTNYISTHKPPITEDNTNLLVSTHSPVVLGAYDQFGNFTGIDPNQNLSLDTFPIKEDIPGSTFQYTAEGQYIFLPKGGTYNFEYKGIGTGPTTVEIDNFSADISTPVVSYTDIPTTPSTSATFVVDSTTPQNTVINLDTNSDGTTDDTIRADGTELSLDELIVLFKQKISTLIVTDKLKQSLLKKIASIEKKISDNKNKSIKSVNPDKKQALTKALANLAKDITKKAVNGKISDVDAQALLDLLTQIEAVI